MLQYFLNNLRVFYTGNDFHFATTLLTFLDFYGEDSLQSLSPGHHFIMNERASEVMGLVGQFRNQWKKYVEQMDKMGRRIDSLTGDFQELVTTRTRQLEKPLDKIENISIDSAVDALEPPE